MQTHARPRAGGKYQPIARRPSTVDRRPSRAVFFSGKGGLPRTAPVNHADRNLPKEAPMRLLPLERLGTRELEGNTVQFGIFLPWGNPANGHRMRGKIIHEKDQFLQT